MNRFLTSIVIAIIFTAFIIAGGLSYIKNHRRQNTIADQRAPQAKVTIIEGWTLDDIAEDLNRNLKRDPERLASGRDFLAAANSYPTSQFPILASKPASSSLEGFLFPDTYFVPIDTASPTATSNSLIAKALDNFSKKFTPAMQSRSQEMKSRESRENTN
jgi:UPF0755 protein